MDTIFANFFSDVSTICGHEATLHANFMHQLLLDGVPCESVVRECPIDGKRVDLVLSADRRDGAWVAGDAVTVSAFPFFSLIGREVGPLAASGQGTTTKGTILYR